MVKTDLAASHPYTSPLDAGLTSLQRRPLAQTNIRTSVQVSSHQQYQ